MDEDLCLHVLKRVADGVLRCDCGALCETLCCACGTAVDAERVEQSPKRPGYRCARCPALQCSRCMLDSSRVDGAAQCDRCATANGRAFDPRRWCVSLTFFFVSTNEPTRVERHLLNVLPASLAEAVRASGDYLGAFYNQSSALIAPLVYQLEQQQLDELRRREVRLSTETAHVGSDSARLEFHAKQIVVGDRSPHILPLQMHASAPSPTQRIDEDEPSEQQFEP